MVALGMLLLGLSVGQTGAATYDLLLKGGHVIDARNGVSAVRDVAIKDGKIAAVSPAIDPAAAVKTVDVSGLYVTPGLIDVHFHAYAGGTYPRGVAPDGFTFRTALRPWSTRAARAGGPSTISRPASSLPPIKNGHRPLLTDPGLGITIDEDKLKAQVGEPRPYLTRFDPDDGSVVDW